MLCRAGMGFGLLGLAGTLQSAGSLNAAAAEHASLLTHFPARAKRVIYVFMNGGPSHVDTFDPKPALQKHAGQMPSSKTGQAKPGGFMASPFTFKHHGRSGLVLSELFPNLARCADDLCIVRSMHTDIPN